MSKEKGKREVKKDMKKIKSEFKKVVALNSYLHNQIESINETKLLKGSSPLTFQDPSDPSISGTTPLIHHQGSHLDFDNFKTVNPVEASHDSLKENMSMYMTKQNDNIAQMNNMFMDKGFPEPPLISQTSNKSESEANLVQEPSSSATPHNESNSSNEIESIIMDNKSGVSKDSSSQNLQVHSEVNANEISEIKVNKSSEKADSESIEYNYNPQAHSQHPDVYINNYLDKAKISSSIILENIGDFAEVPMDKTRHCAPEEDQHHKMEFSPISPMDLNHKLGNDEIQQMMQSVSQYFHNFCRLIIS